jgi:hypothetical protein
MGGSAQTRTHLKRVYAFLAAFGVLWATTLLPIVHQWDHHDDHVHTAAGIVPVAPHEWEHEHAYDDEHEHEHEHEADVDHDHAPLDAHHGEGSIEHGYAVLAELPPAPEPVLGDAQLLEIERIAAPTLHSFEVVRDVACRGPPAELRAL